MTSTPVGSSPIILHNVMRIHDGQLEEFTAAIHAAVDHVERNGTPLMVQVFLDPENMLAHSIQLHRDSESIERHVDIAAQGIARVMDHCTIQRFDVFGDVSPAVRALLPDESVPGQILPPVSGFLRLAGQA
ncbi:hypothetical protein RIF23_14610 [Lipingzhangella sp. LS1_29]|uniref:Quinol monooxygenase YgiN n=1 Tax=Lipingzhangella rawalii TaxID=2055835 RepID=A0ABU2H894_9ACTN|nr:hypothetical protein [Lipingzhangella rawalii]MDS1271528.1 hypothetical protein [Lipingzhangella rawalii]